VTDRVDPVVPDAAAADDDTPLLTPPRTRGGRRRATTPPPPGSDPTPAPEPPRISPRENDQRMLDDVPPHY